MHVNDKDLVTALAAQVGGSTLDAAVYARIDTPLGPARWLGPLGNYLVARPAARAAAGVASERTDVPLDAAMVLGIVGGELHVWAADPMLSRVGDHLGAVGLDRVTAMRAEPSGGWWPLHIGLDDGQSLEVQARGDVGGLVGAWEASRPGA